MIVIRPTLALPVGVTSILAGFLIASGSRRADALALGGPPGIGWKQAAGIALGLAVVVLGLALLAAALRDQTLRQAVFGTEGRHVLGAFVLAFALYMGAKEVMNPPIIGDQPHYMIEAYSLAYDRDRDLRNDYGDPFRFGGLFGAFVPDGHYAAGTGKPYAVHNAGLPALLTPAVIVTHEPDGMRIELVLVSAAAAALLLGVLLRLPFGDRRWLVYVVWALFAFSLPFFTHSAAAFPEMPAALLALVAVRVLLEPRAGLSLLVVASTAAALLPWLHIRFTLLAVALVVALSIRAWQARRSARFAALPLSVLIVSHALMAVGFERWYGSPMLNAPYRFTGNGLSAPWAYRHSLGGVFSADYGWLPFAPFHLLAFVGAAYLAVRYGRWAIAGCVVSLGYLAFAGSIVGAYTGYAFPGRLQFVVVPFAAIPVLALLAGLRRLWPLAAGLGGLTLLLTIDGLRYSEGMLPDIAPNEGGSPLARRLAPLWPAFANSSGAGYPDWPHAVLLLAAIVGLGAVLPLSGVRRRLGRPRRGAAPSSPM